MKTLYPSSQRLCPTVEEDESEAGGGGDGGGRSEQEEIATMSFLYFKVTKHCLLL